MGLCHVMWVSVLTSTTSQKLWVCVMLCGCLCSLLHLRSCGFVSCYVGVCAHYYISEVVEVCHVMWVSVLTTTSQKYWVCVMLCGCLCSLLHLRSSGFVSCYVGVCAHYYISEVVGLCHVMWVSVLTTTSQK